VVTRFDLRPLLLATLPFAACVACNGILDIEAPYIVATQGADGGQGSGDGGGDGQPAPQCGAFAADPANCGYASHSCQGGACIACACQPSKLASDPNAQGYLAVRDGFIAWTENASVLGCPTAACSNPVTMASMQLDPTTIVIDQRDHAWWTNGLSGGGAVETCADQNCPPTLSGFASNQSFANAIALDAANAYWVAAVDANDYGVLECPLSGCGAGANNLATSMTTPSAIVSDGVNAYWTDPLVGILQCAVTGCGQSPTLLADQTTSPTLLASDATHLYWLGSDGISTCALSACTPSLLYGPPAEVTIQTMTVDAGHLYVLSYDGSGGASVSVCTLPQCALWTRIYAWKLAGAGLPYFNVVADDTSLYFFDDTGVLTKLAKP
jgi:hypothetical protein